MLDATKGDSMADMPLFIYVHGIGNKLAPDAAKRQWDVDLFTEDMGDRTRMVYWADLRYKEPLPSRELQRLLETRGLVAEMTVENFEAAGDEGAAFQAAVLSEYLSYGGRRDAALAKEYGPEVFGPIGDLLIPYVLRLFLQDAHAYFFGPERDEIRDRMRDVLREVHEPVVVVGHSLGGIISYDILSELEFGDLQVVHYITMGTQLGVGEIQRQIGQPLRAPGSVGAWTNFFDRWDPSPMAQTLSDEFQHHRIDLRDVEVDNLSESNHSSGGYLRTPELRKLVGQILGRPLP